MSSALWEVTTIGLLLKLDLTAAAIRTSQVVQPKMHRPCQHLMGMWLVQVLYREQAAGMYTAMPFALAQCCVEIPWNLLQSILFSCVSYWMINFAHDAAKFFW